MATNGEEEERGGAGWLLEPTEIRNGRLLLWFAKKFPELLSPRFFLLPSLSSCLSSTFIFFVLLFLSDPNKDFF